MCRARWAGTTGMVHWAWDEGSWGLLGIGEGQFPFLSGEEPHSFLRRFQAKLDPEPKETFRSADEARVFGAGRCGSSGSCLGSECEQGSECTRRLEAAWWI